MSASTLSTVPLSDSEERIAQRVAALITVSRGSEPTHYTISEVAQHLRCSERQAWRLVSLGQVRARKIAGKTFVDAVELERYRTEAR